MRAVTTIARLQNGHDRIEKWRHGKQPRDARLVMSHADMPAGPRDIYVYFDNDAKVHAPFDALRLVRRLSGQRGAA